MSKRIDNQSLRFIISRLGEVLGYCAVRAKQLDAVKMKSVEPELLPSKKNAYPLKKLIHQGGGSYNHNTPPPTANKNLTQGKVKGSPRCLKRSKNALQLDFSDENGNGVSWCYRCKKGTKSANADCEECGWMTK